MHFFSACAALAAVAATVTLAAPLQATVPTVHARSNVSPLPNVDAVGAQNILEKRVRGAPGVAEPRVPEWNTIGAPNKKKIDRKNTESKNRGLAERRKADRKAKAAKMAGEEEGAPADNESTV
ncbi:hypothetical protein EIP91_003400 [Steccherinum ochraceum]|uniref:Uncharacterized protein n=1 Tax=Steccherinum ochraceum TaxID=92696 RepID=A0A4R0RC22_9APHY|nr:hypothetical protein EIP91_003400 [Steccherinum ochraceum]